MGIVDQIEQIFGRIPKDHHDWGYEITIVNTPLYCNKLIVLENDVSSSEHYHLVKDETFIVLGGKVSIIVANDNVAKVLNEGEVLHVPNGVRHRFRAFEKPAVILEVSTNDRGDDTYRVYEKIDYGRYVREWLKDNGYKLDSGAWVINEPAYSNIVDFIGVNIHSKTNCGMDKIDFRKVQEALRNEGYVSNTVRR